MDEVAGISGGVPPLALYPTSNVAAHLRSKGTEWEACLDSWLFSLEYRLRLQENAFKKLKLSQNASGASFLHSFLRSNNGTDVAALKAQKEKLLFKRAYLLLRRLLLITSTPFDYDNAGLLDLLQYASSTYSSVADWNTTLKEMWKRDPKQLTHALEEWKKRISSSLTAQPQSDSLLADLHRINALLKVSADAGVVLMTGSDYLETLVEAFDQVQPVSEKASLQRALTEHLFYGLRSLMADGSPHGSLLLDHLYFLKSDTDKKSKSKHHQSTLCSSLICNTSFLRHLAADPAISTGKRGQGLLDYLTTHRQNTKHLHPPAGPPRRRVTKGKGKVNPREEMHIHKASQISQVHDLFPNLPNHYILRLLDHFQDNTEAAVAALLEPDSLSEDLRDQSSHNGDFSDIAGPAHDLAPRSTPPLPEPRRNVFDGDDFDKLRISSNRLHRGRRDIDLSQAETEDDHASRKAAIISALATFDADDDERDDTYDVADVGGTVDATLDTDERPRQDRHSDQNPHEESLFRAWRDNSELFARDSKPRISKTRQDLKRETNMSDEQIEGWAIMLKKDPNLQNRLERKYAASQTHRGTQNVLTSTRWQGDNTPEDSEEGESGNAGAGRRMGQAQIRGNRVWGRGRGGGSTAGPSDDTATQAARRRKEQGRGRGGASHNRREGRARKMGRGMAGAVQQ